MVDIPLTTHAFGYQIVTSSKSSHIGSPLLKKYSVCFFYGSACVPILNYTICSAHESNKTRIKSHSISEPISVEGQPSPTTPPIQIWSRDLQNGPILRVNGLWGLSNKFPTMELSKYWTQIGSNLYDVTNMSWRHIQALKRF